MSSFAMSDDELEDVFDQIPSLAARPRTLQALSGGLTNRNIRVTTPDGDFVVRCSDPKHNALGIDRHAEHANTISAHAAGVGAPVHDFRPDLGILVIGFLDGRTLCRGDFGEDGLIPRIARACHTLHAGPRFCGDFDMFERQKGYLATARHNGFRIPEGYAELGTQLAEIREALDALDEGTVPCNNDLLAENFVDDGRRIWIIDYEYAGNNDACFELGNIWAECRLGLDQLEELITSYYGRHRPSKVARARLLGAVGQYGWTLWGAIQQATSPIDFDFWGWGMERFEIAARELRGPDLPRLLEEVRTPD